MLAGSAVVLLFFFDGSLCVHFFRGRECENVIQGLQEGWSRYNNLFCAYKNV